MFAPKSTKGSRIHLALAHWKWHTPPVEKLSKALHVCDWHCVIHSVDWEFMYWTSPQCKILVSPVWMLRVLEKCSFLDSWLRYAGVQDIISSYHYMSLKLEWMIQLISILKCCHFIAELVHYIRSSPGFPTNGRLNGECMCHMGATGNVITSYHWLRLEC
jgi:hypothetical protein